MTSQTEMDRSYVYRISLVAAMGGFLFGYDLSIISGAIIFLKSEFQLSPGSEAFAIGSATIGCMVGPIAGMWLADSRFGRKWSLMLAAQLFLVGAIGTAFPRNMIQFNIFRIVGGVGVGLASVISPMYIAEVSPARIRGRLVTLNQLAIVVGATAASVLAYLLTPEISGLSPDLSWRWMFASTAVPTIILMAGLFGIPNSPRWMAERGLDQEALRVLSRIDGPDSARVELKAIQTTLAEEGGSFRELIQPGVRIALIIAVALALFQQYTGVSTMTFYGPIIYQKAGFQQASHALRLAMFQNLWNIFITVVSMLIVDRTGRRPLLLWGVAGMGLSQILLGSFFFFNIKGFFVVTAMYLCMATYIISLAPLAWLIMSELFPTRIRARGMAFGSLACWVATGTSIQVLGPLMAYLERTFGNPAGAFWMYAWICLGCWLFSYKMVPETKGKTLEEIAGIWLQKK
ncbi:MAG: sugar porter family MFS transporter [Terriglobia bacterium]